MREILFRGKRIDNGEWVEGWLVFKTDPVLEITYCYILAYGKGESFVTWYPIDPATVGECVGLSDKNGKKIFEGDIVRYEIWAGACVLFRSDLMHVEWSEQTAQFIVTGDCSYIMGSAYKYEIIGNIHDNPELLKGD